MARAPNEADARGRALAALLAVDVDGQGTQYALRQALDTEPPLHGPDRALATELVYGVQRKRRPLDAWIATAATRGLYAMEAPVLEALRLGAYQLAYLPRVPRFAAVHATVEASKALVPQRQIGFLHAVLRGLARQAETGRVLEGEELPAWISLRIAEFAERSGLDPVALQAAFLGPAPLHVHAVGGDDQVLAALVAEGLPVQPLKNVAVPGVGEVTGGGVFGSAAFAARRVLAQDAGSAAVVEWLGAQPGMRVADIAAGRGVKSLCLTSRGAEVTAVDVGSDKLVDAELLCRRAGHPLHATLVADAAAGIPLPRQAFDAVLVDAPCTGLGTLRRRPEVRHRRYAADLLRMGDLQRRILEQAAPLCRPGGVLLFATCSFAAEEGPQVVSGFLSHHPEFERDPGTAAWALPLLDAQGDLRTHPLLGGMDAFQAVRLRRRPA